MFQVSGCAAGFPPPGDASGKPDLALKTPDPLSLVQHSLPQEVQQRVSCCIAEPSLIVEAHAYACCPSCHAECTMCCVYVHICLWFCAAYHALSCFATCRGLHSRATALQPLHSPLGYAPPPTMSPCTEMTHSLVSSHHVVQACCAHDRSCPASSG